jgi:hypothetical protein
MVSIFSIPKAFKGHVGTIQRNAITSWTLLQPRPEIILFGNDAGTAELASELGLRHIPEIASNEYGTPLLNDLFCQAELNAVSSTMCYINADIVVLSDFWRLLARPIESMKRFLIVSERINLDVTEEIRFDGDWEVPFRQHIQKSGIRSGHMGIDIFAFPKGTYPHVPEFGIGRTLFDQWLIKAARESGIPVIDLSRAAAVIHQNHDYKHVAGGADWIWRGKEAEHNLRLYDAAPHSFTLLDCTHELTADGVLRRIWLRRPLYDFRHTLWEVFVHHTVGVRDKLKLRRKFWRVTHD